MTKTVDRSVLNTKMILICEDEEYNFILLDSILTRHGVNIIWAKDGKQAVDHAQKFNVDIVLMDIKMPIMDGIDAYREIRKFNKDVPIIAQTAYALQEDRERIMDVGFDEHVGKPIKSQQLLDVMCRFIA
jgi:two-component system, cell cycle response regulator DivK